MHADAETHSQTLGGASGTPQKRRRKDHGSQWSQGHHKNNQLSGAHRGSWRLKVQSWTPGGSDLGPLHILYGCVLGVLVGVEGVSDSYLLLGLFASCWVALSRLDMGLHLVLS